MARPPTAFATTRWSLVARAVGTDDNARKALGELLAAYWQPLYAFLRRAGRSPEDASDLVQGLFTRLVEKDALAQVEPGPARGRFRSFLLRALQHFAANAHRHDRAAKRGGGTTVSLEAAAMTAAEATVQRDLVTQETPERHFERSWALAVLANALERVGEEFAQRGRGPLFAQLRGYLDLEPRHTPYADLARELGMTEGAVKVAVHRLRERFRTVLRATVAETLANESEIDDEIDALLTALQR
jgi:RNA polymerase sigma factor (sigma-70 family)